MAENTASDTERRGCLPAKGTAELAQHDPTVAGRSAEAMTALLALLRTEISAAQRHGDIDSAADPERLAALLLTVVRAIATVGKSGLTPEALRNIADTALGGPARARGAETPHHRAQPGPREPTRCHHGHLIRRTAPKPDPRILLGQTNKSRGLTWLSSALDDRLGSEAAT
ncbi:TetR family transcriptional regulator C-terminal domain-containing protein [Streptomyces sp. MNP-20]|uniref:TetR family transcriptional regulator C-terminal domain-containing protein n=1 Tax=Streptomyces sp. MNP-20 TaxID=2721165 RepID=UPI0020A6CCD0|nr:hypothetical protein [Streptomyces sp. MNP-20]